MALSNYLKIATGIFCLIGFYRRFIGNYTSLSFNLTELLKKNTFHWNNTPKLSFKTALAKALVLALPDFTKTFVIQTDASGMGKEAVLTQNGHPISYFSRRFCPKLLNSSTYA